MARLCVKVHVGAGHFMFLLIIVNYSERGVQYVISLQVRMNTPIVSVFLLLDNNANYLADKSFSLTSFIEVSLYQV